MNDDLLATYLNDHLAGSVLAIDHAEHCRSKNADEPLAAFLAGLIAEIEEDQAVLKQIMERVGAKESTARKAAAWITEKAARLKFGGSEEADLAFNRMQQLEGLMLGIRGKLGLWEVLEPLSESDSRLSGFGWAELKRRAEDQVERVDERRREAARQAFLTTSDN